MLARQESATKRSAVCPGPLFSPHSETDSALYFLYAKGLKYTAIAKLPRSRFGEAMKDMDSERGKAMVVSGTVIQIHKDGHMFRGQMCADTFCTKIFYFFTSGTTRGITQHKRRRFAGILTQLHSYSNTRGGTTHSLLLVGYFKGQK